MKTRIFITLICSLFLVGCATNIASQKLDIVPGEGIAEVACLGMHAQDVARNTGNGLLVQVTGESGSLAYVPTLGIHWRQETEEDTRDGILRLKIIIDPSGYGRGCLFQNIQPFRGTLCGTLSMSKPSDLTRRRLISVFGEPLHSFVLPAAGADCQKCMRDFGSTIRHGQSASLRTSAKSELLVYPARGIEFWMSDNVLGEIEIMKKVEQSAAPLPRPPNTGHADGAH